MRLRLLAGLFFCGSVFCGSVVCGSFFCGRCFLSDFSNRFLGWSFGCFGFRSWCFLNRCFLGWSLEELPPYFRERDRAAKWKYLVEWLGEVRSARLRPPGSTSWVASERG